VWRRSTAGLAPNERPLQASAFVKTLQSTSKYDFSIA
jgi:hypothetical protein